MCVEPRAAAAKPCDHPAEDEGCCSPLAQLAASSRCVSECSASSSLSLIEVSAAAATARGVAGRIVHRSCAALSSRRVSRNRRCAAGSGGPAAAASASRRMLRSNAAWALTRRVLGSRGQVR